MQVETTVGYHLATRMAIIKKKQKIGIGKDVETSELSYPT